MGRTCALPPVCCTPLTIPLKAELQNGGAICLNEEPEEKLDCTGGLVEPVSRYAHNSGGEKYRAWLTSCPNWFGLGCLENEKLLYDETADSYPVNTVWAGGQTSK